MNAATHWPSSWSTELSEIGEWRIYPFYHLLDTREHTDQRVAIKQALCWLQALTIEYNNTHCMYDIVYIFLKFLSFMYTPVQAVIQACGVTDVASFSLVQYCQHLGW